jgi:hypothetical protein
MNTLAVHLLRAGLIASATASLLAQPTITSQPKSQSVSLGATVTFRVRATGTAPLSYRWRHGEAELAGASTNSLVLTDVQLAQVGDYRAEVTDNTDSGQSSRHPGVYPTFTKITTGSIVSEKGEFHCAPGRYDNDGWSDLS